MRNLTPLAAALALIATGALAQTTPPAQNGPQNSAINSSTSSNRDVAAPVKGRNSFTQGEAKSRIEKYGFSNVSNLQKDQSGIWRGQAMKDGRQVEVSLDYQGNVVEGGAGSTVPNNAARGNAGR